MSQVVRTSLSCPRCGHTFPAIIEQIIDVGRDPQAKARFLSGRANMVACPNCGHTLAVGTPLLYHDPAKELMVIHVPMELNISTQERERLIGDLTRRVTESIPQAQRKAYLLTPKQALTIPGMIDMILDADGITEDMRNAQRAKMQVINLFLQAGPNQWQKLVQEQDELIDHEFFQMLLASIENSSETGREEMAQALTMLYNFLIQNTTVGQEVLQSAQAQEQVVQAIAAELEAMGDDMTREDFMNLVLQSADDDERIQALVGLIRPAFDYGFFQELTKKIEAASGADKETLTHLRARLTDLTSLIDTQTQAVLQRATETLRIILNSEDIEAAIRPRMDMIDDTFLAVLQANIQATAQNGDKTTAERLQHVLQTVLKILRENAPPQIRFINDLMNTETDDTARALIAERAPAFGPELTELMDAVADDLEANEQDRAAKRLRGLRAYAANHIGDAPQRSAKLSR